MLKIEKFPLSWSGEGYTEVGLRILKDLETSNKKEKSFTY